MGSWHRMATRARDQGQIEVTISTSQPTSAPLLPHSNLETSGSLAPPYMASAASVGVTPPHHHQPGQDGGSPTTTRTGLGVVHLPPLGQDGGSPTTTRTGRWFTYHHHQDRTRVVHQHTVSTLQWFIVNDTLSIFTTTRPTPHPLRMPKAGRRGVLTTCTTSVLWLHLMSWMRPFTFPNGPPLDDPNLSIEETSLPVASQPRQPRILKLAARADLQQRVGLLNCSRAGVLKDFVCMRDNGQLLLSRGNRGRMIGCHLHTRSLVVAR